DGLYTEAFMATLENKEKGQEKYFKILKEIASKYPDEKRVHFDLGVYYHNNKMTQEAIEEFNKALRLDPKFGYAINQLAYVYSSMNEFEKALEYFKNYAAVSPGDANPFDSMGEMYFYMGKLDESIEKFKEALEVKPDFVSGWKISYIYALKENYDEAFKWVDQYISKAPSLPLKSLGYQLKAFYYYILGNLEQAFKTVDKAEELAWKEKDMNLVDIAYRMKLWICYEWGKIELFRDYAKKRMEFRTNNNIDDENYNNILFNFYEGVIDVKSGQIEKAKSKLKAIQTLLPELEPRLAKEAKMTTLDYLHILILIEEGSADEAIEFIKKMPPPKISFNIVVTFIRRNLPFDDDLMARALFKKGEIDKAVADYERITTLNLDIGLDRPLIHPLSRYRLAKLYEETGQIEKAAEQYRKALDIWENADVGLSPVEDAKQRLTALKSKSSSR
ncbi:MAG: tetratricopeptide repeat protein, partial [Candidatus Aminicenantes bacterium]|nr:tetratricopeptide repeat protein [Candidatus Aminicenantes bacterium]